MRWHGMDQATGLRRIFAPQGGRMAAVFGADGAATARVATQCALALAAEGRSVLVVDEHGAAAASLGAACHLDLLEVLAGRQALAHAVQPARGGVAVLAAMRAARMAQPQDAGQHHAWMRWREGLASGRDLVVVHGADGATVSPLAHAARDWVVVAGAGSRGITAAYARIKRLARAGAQRHLRMVVSGAAGADQALQVFASVQRVAAERLGLNIDLLGWLPGEDGNAHAGGRLPSGSARAGALIAHALVDEARCGDPRAIRLGAAHRRGETTHGMANTIHRAAGEM